jgi:putative aldouronate transport system permease protein
MSPQSGALPRKSTDAAVKPPGVWRAVLRHKYFYIMLAPVLAWYLIFCYVPMYGVVTAFQDYVMTRGVLGSAWVGLKHFRTLWADKLFWRSFRNSVILAGLRMVFEFSTPILLSILINELRHAWIRKTAQTVLYLPHFLSWITVASIVVTFINPDKSLITALAKGLGEKIPRTPSQTKRFEACL